MIRSRYVSIEKYIYLIYNNNKNKMVKVRVNLSIEHDVLMACKENDINISNELESILRSKLDDFSQNIDNFKVGHLKRMYQKKVKNMDKMRLEVQNMRQKLENFDKKRQEEEEKKLLEEEIKLKNAKTCLICKSIITEKKNKLKTKSGGIICKSCFMSGNDPTKW